MDEKVTKPTIETVLDRMNAMEQRLGDRIDATEQRMGERIDASEQRMGERMKSLEDRLGTRLDRIEVMTNTTRTDFLELRLKLREHVPALQ